MDLDHVVRSLLKLGAPKAHKGKNKHVCYLETLLFCFLMYILHYLGMFETKLLRGNGFSIFQNAVALQTMILIVVLVHFSVNLPTLSQAHLQLGQVVFFRDIVKVQKIFSKCSIVSGGIFHQSTYTNTNKQKHTHKQKHADTASGTTLRGVLRWRSERVQRDQGGSVSGNGCRH